MATITRRGKNQWRARVRRGATTTSRTFSTRDRAEAWARQVEEEIAGGEFAARGEAEATTLGAALDRYEQEIIPNKAPATRPAERRRVHALRRRSIAHLPLSRIGGKDVAEFIRERQAEGVGANTIRLDLATISHLYTVARTAWGMPHLTNPVPLAQTAKPRLPGGRERRLQDGEEDKLLAAAGAGLRPAIRFALATAMRRGEIAGLRWEHVNLKQRSAHLPKTKNGTARTVPLSLEAVAILQSLPRRLDGRVFNLGSESITSDMFMACRAAGITGLTFHDLRHEAISRLFENTDLDAMEIARISGHRTLSMLSRYTHLRAHRLAERMDGAPRTRRPKGKK
ncbi:MAG: tyrosine-type recombinase/integrase [Acidiferrobacterales bacterium]